jgi:chromosome segregation ATPase
MPTTQEIAIILTAIGTIFAGLAGVSSLIVSLSERKKKLQLQQIEASRLEMEKEAQKIQFTEQITNIARGLIANLENEIERLKATYKEQRIEWAEKVKELESQIRCLEESQEEQRGIISTQSTTIRQLTDENRELKLGFAGLKRENASLVEELAIRDQVNLHRESEINVMRSQVDELRKAKTGTLKAKSK